MKKHASRVIYSPSDLVRFLGSPFASWMDRFYLENPQAITPDEEPEDARLVMQTGLEHERAVLEQFVTAVPALVQVRTQDSAAAQAETLKAILAKSPVIYQAALADDPFAGFADFIILTTDGKYQVWDTKLARSPKPYYIIQLCCYSEMLAAITGALPQKLGIILGSHERVEFRVEDFIHYYRKVKASFLAMHSIFTGNLEERPEPLPRADHGRWGSHAERFFRERDHLVQVAGITVGQIKKLKRVGIDTMRGLAATTRKSVEKLPEESLGKLVAQAKLQCQTLEDRLKDAEASPRFEVLLRKNPNGAPEGLAALPVEHPADVFFDMEGYPLVAGGLEYLFGAYVLKEAPSFHDWWAHDRDEEKVALEGFVDWVFESWTRNPGMHIYHYAAYEVSAVRRLSTRHDTRQHEVDELLRNEVFVDLYKIVRHALRIGEDNYSIKSVERLYRPKRATQVATAVDSIVQYAHWIQSKEPRDWKRSPILKGIRDYNEDDCKSTAELLQWLRTVAAKHAVAPLRSASTPKIQEPSAVSPEVAARLDTVANLRRQTDPLAAVLADLIGFHRREEKPMWWRMFDRAAATPEELRDDPGCIEGIQKVGLAVPEKKSMCQEYRFDPSQECKLSAGEKSKLMFTHNLNAKCTVIRMDAIKGELTLKISNQKLKETFGGFFPDTGSLIEDEYVGSGEIPQALSAVAAGHLSGQLHAPVAALLNRVPPSSLMQSKGESVTDAAIRITKRMAGGCLVIQGPPGTGKTYTASRVIHALLTAGKKVGISSNSHKAIANLLKATSEAAKEAGRSLVGIEVGGDASCPGLRHVEKNSDAWEAYGGGVVGGTAWLFSRAEWQGSLDFLFIDEAGQVSLANVFAMARCAKNLVLLGDQMQLEQPIQGSHPGDSGLSALQYALKDTIASRPDAPVFHAVVPSSYGLFLGECRRMHPSICQLISESIYEGRLGSHCDCSKQRISMGPITSSINKEAGVIFIGVEHDGNVQQSDEEVQQVRDIYAALAGRPYTAKDGITRPLSLSDFLFIAPYNAQVRALKAALPVEARVGSVDKFQGQEAPVCILSLCSSFGEYGSRGMAFILDRNRVNVAISRAQCLAIVVADPRIASAAGGSINEMSLLNLFCKLTGYADGPPSHENRAARRSVVDNQPVGL